MKREWKKLSVVILGFLLIVAMVTPVIASQKAALTVNPNQKAVVTGNIPLLNPISAFFQPLADWCKQPASHAKNVITFALSTNSGVNDVVSYARGTLYYNPANGTFEGDGVQYFSDRLWGYPATGNIISPAVNPFSPNKTDKIHVKIDPSTGVATIALTSWGGGLETFNLKVLLDNQLLYAVGDPGSNVWQSIVLSFKKGSEAILY